MFGMQSFDILNQRYQISFLQIDFCEKIQHTFFSIARRFKVDIWFFFKLAFWIFLQEKFFIANS